MAENFFVYKGAIHVHTKLSDGSGDLNTVISAAKLADLDWAVITDHNHYDTEEGIYDGIYVIKAQEVSPHDKNHYLVFGMNETVRPDENAQKYVDYVRQKGGFGFAAHPDEGFVFDKYMNAIPRKNSHHCIPWTDKSIKPDGIEIWNWFSNWADNLDDGNILSLAYAYLFKHNIVKKPSDFTLRWWDELNLETSKIIPAIGGVDAHALKFYRYIIPVTVFPYDVCFKTITNFVYLNEKLSDDFEVAKQQILNAIKNGNNIIINRHICNVLPQIYLTSGEQKLFCGSDVKLNDNCCLHFYSDKEMKICLIYNGSVEEMYISNSFVYKIAKSGKYRLEVAYKERPFLYTNPFNVKD